MVLGGLANDAFIVMNHLVLHFLLAGKPVAGHALKTAMVFAHIHSSDHRTQVLGTELQDIAP